MTSLAPLPIDAALPELRAALRTGPNAVLQAPPGAGKTTRVPLTLLAESWANAGRIVMLEPRRIAARAAAERMAQSLGETVGETVGYRIRGAARVGSRTRIEVVTEGILTRRVQSDPELADVAMVIFDEFHERSVHADLGLALCLEAQAALRPDLRLLVMSATLDGGPVAALMTRWAETPAPVVTSLGRAHPVTTIWLDAPWSRPNHSHSRQPHPDRRGPRFEAAMADLIARAVAEHPGDALAFLPGAGEIRRVESLLPPRLDLGFDPQFDIRPLYGEASAARQRAALDPAPAGRRKIVLATAIAETSLTIDGVRIVIDGGRARRARFDPGSGMSRLITERVSKAGAEQRRGRAGRTGPGVCLRLWTRGEEGGMARFSLPQILDADLASVALDLALWGASEPTAMPFLDPPPAAALDQARALLRDLGALDTAGRITALGRAAAAAPTHPRLGCMALKAMAAGLGGLGCDLAALLDERDPMRVPGAPPPPADLRLRIEALRDPVRFAAARGHALDRAALSRAREGAKRLRKALKITDGDGRPNDAGAVLALAYPDRIGLRRPGEAPRYLLSGGKGAAISPDDPLARERLIVAADLDGEAREARVRLTAPITAAQIEATHGERIETAEICEWSRRERAVLARRRRMLGALALSDETWAGADPAALGAAMAEGVRHLGLSVLPWSAAARQLRDRAMWLRARTSRGADGNATAGPPDWSDAELLATLDLWLTPYLAGRRRAGDLDGLDMAAILRAALGGTQAERLDRLAPAYFKTPAGSRLPIDYAGEQPRLSVRLQEMFGVTAHPVVGDRQTPLLIEFLSPARRPVQTTGDIARFWAESYHDVRKDMRGRYPRHSWPEDPAVAPPMRRAKPRPRR